MENIKAVAAKCLIDSRISFLPVEVMRLEASRKRWIIGPYKENTELLQLHGWEEYAKTVSAFSTEITDNVYLIIYDEKLSYNQRNEYSQ